jgi:surface polysaccharide O-acyltransferase-like enzyme
MMMVVCLHTLNHGGLIGEALIPGTVNWYLGNIIFAASNVAVNCFVLLSGYFQCTSQFKLKRIVGIWVQAACYSVALYAAAGIFSGTFSIVGFARSALPVTMKQYWFTTAYLLMYAVSPFLNQAIRAMSRRMHLMCCCVLLAIFSAMHNLVYISDFGNILGGSSFLWFCILYLVAAYIRLYVPIETKKGKLYFGVYLLSGFLIAAERFAAYAVTPLVFGRVMLDSFFYANNSILMIIASIALLLAMRTLEIRVAVVNKIIGFVAPLVFGVYLIHDHPSVRVPLWKLLNPPAYAESVWMIPYVFTCVVGIFFCCCAVEWIRQKLFRVCGIDSLIDRICGRIQRKAADWLAEENV